MISSLITMRSFPILLVLLLGTLLRFYHIGHQSLWYDEGNSARMTERSAGQIVTAATSDIHPPGYYLILSGWSALMGRSELALRGMSAMAGIVLVALVYQLGNRYWTHNSGLYAALLSAIHPALIYYSQEARMYMLATTLGAAIFALTLNISSAVGGSQGLVGTKQVRFMSENRRVRTQTLNGSYMITVAWGLYTHYSFPFVVVAANLAVLWQAIQRRIQIKACLTRWLPLQVGAMLLFLPWLRTAIHHVTTWPAAREYMSWQQAVPELWQWLTLGPTSNTSTAIPGIAAFALLALIRLLHGHSSPILFWLVLPASSVLAFGLFSESFGKFLLLAVPPVTLLTAGGVVSLWEGSRTPIRETLARISAITLAITTVWFTAVSLANLYNNPEYFRDDYRAIASDIAAIRKTGDAILLHAPNQWEVFTYYYPDAPHIIPLARSRPLDSLGQIAELRSITSNYQRLFVIFWGQDQPDPEHVIERWLNKHTFKAHDRWYGAVRMATYGTPLTTPRSETIIDARFGESIMLEGYALNATTFNPGDIVQLTLYWRSTYSLDNRYKVFVHVYSDTASPPIAQHDSEPNGGLDPTDTWTAGKAIIDNHGVMLPQHLSPGEHQLVVGMYSLESGIRLGTTLNNTDAGDRLSLRAITVDSQHP